MPAASCLPLAIVGNDPAFHGCLKVAVTTPELVEQFDRLCGANLSNGVVEEGDMRAFVTFIYDSIYTRLSDGTLNALRVQAMAKAG